MSYEMHEERIGRKVWDDLKGLRGYLDDIEYDKELCKGLSFHADFDILIKDVKSRISELEKEK